MKATRPAIPFLVGMILLIATACSRAPQPLTMEETSEWADRIARTETGFVPAILQERAEVERIYGNGTRCQTCLRSRGSSWGTDIRYDLRISKAVLNACPVEQTNSDLIVSYSPEGYVIRAGHTGGWNMENMTPEDTVKAAPTWFRRREAVDRDIMIQYADRLPHGPMAPLAAARRNLLKILAEQPGNKLCRLIVIHLPEIDDLELLPLLVKYPSGNSEMEEPIKWRLEKIISRNPSAVQTLKELARTVALSPERSASVRAALEGH